MKKLILFGFIIILAVSGWFVFRSDEVIDNEATNPSENVIDLPVEILSELIVKNELSSKVSKFANDEKEIYLEDKLLNLDYLASVERLLFDYEAESNQLIFVYADQTLHVDFTENVLYVNGEPRENRLFAKKIDTIYINMEVFKEFFSLEIITIEEPFFSLQLDFSSNTLPQIIQSAVEALPEKINMTWEAVYSRKTDVSKLYDMPGLDIISPVWYDLEDGQGSLKSKKQEDYIEWAKESRITLWPALTNGFDTDMTHELISSIDVRSAFIEKLLTIYTENDYKGINIDFENIYKEDKEALSQFIAELTAAFHREGIVVSMDVTFAGGSDTWSKCYDRTVLGQWVDYIVVMSYDQHWGSSPVSGTVAGINWMDENLEKLTNEVDSNKIIMGIPFYMRVWFERPSKDTVDHMKVTSDAITMFAMENILLEDDHTILWDEATGQNYISFINHEDNAVNKIWIEDAESLALKVALVHKYNLKGIASWRRGYELESIWPVLQNALDR